MNNCETFAALLDPFIDGELTVEEAYRVRAHLTQCPDCQDYVTAALAIRDAFPEAEETEVPADFTAGVMAAVAAHPRKKKTTPWRKALLPLAACFALVVLVRHAPIGFGGGAAQAESAAMDMATADTVMEEAAVEVCEDSYSYSADVVNEPVFFADGETLAEDAAEPEAAKAAARMEAHFVTAWLTAEEAAAFLTDAAPVLETETELHYTLTAAEYDALLTALAEAGVMPAEEFPEDDGAAGDTALVIVKK